MLAAKAS